MWLLTLKSVPPSRSLSSYKVAAYIELYHEYLAIG